MATSHPCSAQSNEVPLLQSIRPSRKCNIGKREGRLYALNSATAKQTAKNFWRLKPFPKQLSKIRRSR
jgi:ribosomal protein L36